MEKNNLIIILLVVLIGIVAGVGMLVGINNAVVYATKPIYFKLEELDRDVKALDDKIKSGGGVDSDSLRNIERQVNQIVNKIGNAAPQPQMPPAEDFNKIYDLPIGISSVLRNPNAPVTITEFSDFQCPFCAHFYPVIKQVLAAYPDKVKVVIKNFPLPFHPNARPAAKLAMAANEQGKFQGMMEALLANGGDVSDDKVKQYAKDLGLDYNKLMADYKNNDAQWEKQLQDDATLAGQADVMGTPTFYLNGRKTQARDIDSFKAQIDPILAGRK